MELYMSIRQEALELSKKYFDGDELAADTFISKYALRDTQDNILEKTPTEMHWRLANEFARIEKGKFQKPLSAQEIFDLFDHFKYIVPQGSPMYGIGNPYQLVSLGNCFVISLVDSYGGIHTTDQQMTQICKRRGGVGVDVSSLRPYNAPTTNAARSSTGMMTFVERFSNSIREVCQNGRRGAAMQSVSVHHPDVLLFAKAKNDLTKITGANLSIRLTDEFLNAVQNNEDYEQRWPVDSKSPKISRKVSAVKVWKEIIHSAWLVGEPGLIFWDKIIRESVSDCYEKLGFKSIGLNPCGELILEDKGACRLISQNLYSYVKNPFTKNAYFDFDLFKKHVVLAQRLADNLVDLEIEKVSQIIDKVKNDPEPEEIKQVEMNLWQDVIKMAKLGRRTGTGFSALADTMAALGIKYGSEESIKFATEVSKAHKLAAYRSSVDMAKEIGAFPIWDKELEKDNPYLLRIKQEDPILWADMQKYGRRNIAIQTLSPNGTVAIMTQTSSSGEPLFALTSKRRRKVNALDKNVRIDFKDKDGECYQNFDVFHPKLKEWMRITGEADIAKSPWQGCCANDIDWINRVRIQAAMQKNIDHSISSTINLPKDVSEDKVAEIYTEAWKQGLKGITVYRDGCRSGILVRNDEKPDTKDRPKVLNCLIHHIKISKHLDRVRHLDYLVLVGIKNNKPFEVFCLENGYVDKKITKGKIIRVKSGHYNLELEDGKVIENITKNTTEQEDVISRLVSMSLRIGHDLNQVVQQLDKAEGDIYGFSKALSRTLKKYIPDSVPTGEKCQECGGKIIRKDGCSICENGCISSSKCG